MEFTLNNENVELIVFALERYITDMEDEAKAWKQFEEGSNFAELEILKAKNAIDTIVSQAEGQRE